MKTKKLKFNRETVINLDGREMDQLKGGGSDGAICITWMLYTFTCPKQTPPPSGTPPPGTPPPTVWGYSCDGGWTC